MQHVICKLPKAMQFERRYAAWQPWTNTVDQFFKVSSGTAIVVSQNSFEDAAHKSNGGERNTEYERFLRLLQMSE